MNKKLFTSIIFSILLTVCLLFTACGDKELTKEKLEEAFAASETALNDIEGSFEVKFATKSEYGETIENSEIIMKLNDGISYFKFVDEDETNEVYSENKGESLDVYFKDDDDVWRKQTMDNDDSSNDMTESSGLVMVEAILISYEYKDGKYYSKEDNEDVIALLNEDIDEDKEIVSFEAYFTVSGGKINTIYAKTVTEEETTENTVTIKYNIGSITLPEVASEE